MSDVYPKRDMAKNLLVLEDQGFSDFQIRNVPIAHLRKHIEMLAEKRLEHELKTLVHLVLRLVLVLHVAPPYDDWEHFDPDAGIVPFRRVGTMTHMVKVDKAARRVLKAQGYLERTQGYLECGRPYGTGLVATTAGRKRAQELVDITAHHARARDPPGADMENAPPVGRDVGHPRQLCAGGLGRAVQVGRHGLGAQGRQPLQGRDMGLPGLGNRLAGGVPAMIKRLK